MLTRITLVSDGRTCIPNSVLSPIHVQIKLLRIVFPIAPQLMNDHTNFVQDVPQDLPCLPKMLAIYVVENVSKHLDNPIYDFLGFFGASKFTWVQADTASTACPWQPGNLAITSVNFATIIWDANEPCSAKNCKGSRVVFYNVSQEHGSAFVLL